MKVIKNFNELIDISTKINETKTYSIDMIINIDNIIYHPYEACISNRELSLYCDDTVILYDVNNVNGYDAALLVDIIKD